MPQRVNESFYTTPPLSRTMWHDSRTPSKLYGARSAPPLTPHSHSRILLSVKQYTPKYPKGLTRSGGDARAPAEFVRVRDRSAFWVLTIRMSTPDTRV